MTCEPAGSGDLIHVTAPCRVAVFQLLESAPVEPAFSANLHHATRPVSPPLMSIPTLATGRARLQMRNSLSEPRRLAGGDPGWSAISAWPISVGAPLVPASAPV